jgi:hypothetical protein
MLTGRSPSGWRKQGERVNSNGGSPSTIADTGPGKGYGLDVDPGFAIISGQVRRTREIAMMKNLTLAAVILALITAPVQAQMKGKRPQGDDKKTEERKSQVDEKAYKAALERIPEPKEKYDPWGVARPPDSAKKSK